MKKDFHAPLLIAALLALTACGGDSAGSKNAAPLAKAGPDQTVEDGQLVTLDGSGSSDAEDGVLSFSWSQASGPAITLSDRNAPQPTFTAPVIPGGTKLTFELLVTDSRNASSSDTVTITVNDVTAPTSSPLPETKVLGKEEMIELTFSEPMDPESLALGGELGGESQADWSGSNTTLTIAPSNASGMWTSGSSRKLELRASDTSGNEVTLSGEWLVKLVFDTYQAADVVIGQPDMISGTWMDSASSFHSLYGRAAVHEGTLYAPDYGGTRVLGFNTLPVENGAPADFVIGQTDFSSGDYGVSSQLLHGPQAVQVHDNKFLVLEWDNGRISIYEPTPTSTENSGPGTISAVVGQADTDTVTYGCSNSVLFGPEDFIVTPDGRLIVSDSNNHRVLIWNTLPTAHGQPADLVLGQLGFNSCAHNDADGDGNPESTPTAATLSYPTGVWSDGDKLVVLDFSNNRALIWNSFPASNGQPADLVLGQAAFSSWQHNDSNGDGATDSADANTLYSPYNGVTSNGEQLFIADWRNHRVLLWNSWPTQNQQPADVVLGQAEMTYTDPNDSDGDGVIDGISARTLDSPNGLFLNDNQLIVTDAGNIRYLIYNSR